MSQKELLKDNGAIPSNTDSRCTRVLIIAPSLSKLGGQALQCARLVERLKAEPDLEVSFLPTDPRLPGVFHLLQKVKYLRTIVTTLRFWGMLLARMWRYDVVHTFSAAYYSYLLSALPPLALGKLLGKKTILNYRSGEAELHLKSWRSAVPTMRLASVIVVPSGYLVDVFGRAGLSATPIFNFVDVTRFGFRERVPLGPVFLTSRLLEPLYNVGCVLRAFGLIQEQFSDASLVVAGEGSQRTELEELARTLNLKNTKFIGRVPSDEMPTMYNAADICLMATNLDNMPSSLIECLASGLPVVTTDAGGIPYMVRDEETCLMVPCDDHVKMAAASIRLLNDPELALKIAQRGREHCLHWTWESVRMSWLSLYHEVGARSESKNEKHR
jgi:L-malate glycosyltransferase